jgi:hypothetical protein
VTVAAAVLFLVVLVRIAYILGSNTIGEFGQELFYLRWDAFRTPLYVGFGALLLEIMEYVYQFLVYVGFHEIPNWVLWVNAIQACAFAIAALLVLGTLRRYTPAGIQARIDENMGTIALTAGQRRRRRTGERAEREAARGKAREAPRERIEE